MSAAMVSKSGLVANSRPGCCRSRKEIKSTAVRVFCEKRQVCAAHRASTRGGNRAEICAVWRNAWSSSTDRLVFFADRPEASSRLQSSQIGQPRLKCVKRELLGSDAPSSWCSSALDAQHSGESCVRNPSALPTLQGVLCPASTSLSGVPVTSARYGSGTGRTSALISLDRPLFANLSSRDIPATIDMPSAFG